MSLANAERDDGTRLEFAAGVAGDATNLKVSVNYDASNSPFWAMKGLVPLPSSSITRQASIRLGGY